MSQQTPTFTPVERFIRLMKPDAQEIRNVYIYSIFTGLISLSLPIGIQAIINLIQGGQINTAWIVLVSFVVFGVAVTGVLQIFQLRITENLQQKIFTRAAFEFAYRIPKICMEKLYKHYAPELINRFFDTISVQKGLSKILIDFSTAALQIIFGIILLSFYHPFFILFGLFLIILVYIIFRFTAQRGLETSLEESKHKYRVAHWLEELARTYTSFKLTGSTHLPLKRVDDLTGGYLKARESHFKVLVQQYSMLVFFKVIVAAGLLALGGILVMEQVMNIGQFVAAEIIILLIMASVEKLILTLETIYDVLTSFEKIGQVTDLDLESNEGIDISKSSNGHGLAVQLRNVNFTYPDYYKRTLCDVSLSVEQGEKVMIIGKNGAGKSTLLQVAAGLYFVQSGSVSYNGSKRENLNLNILRKVIGASFTNDSLFEGTVLENITIGQPGISLDRVKSIVRSINLNDFIEDLPQGYETKLDPQGQKLPRSVVQKFLIARSLIADPKLLLLEDPFEHLDRQDRVQIIDYLSEENHNWTLMTVSNDHYLAKKMDRIIFMEDGHIIKQGNYDEMKEIVINNTYSYA